jgi:hypothetical protein
MIGTRNRSARIVEQAPATAVWSPAQIVAVVIGIASIAFGAFALTRTGLDLDNLTGPHDSVLSFHHTPLLGLLEIAFGVLLVVAGMRPVAGRALMTLLGGAALGLGIVTVLDLWPRRLHDWLAVHDRNGWLFVIVGATLLAVAFFAPFVHQRDRVTRERVPATDADADV